MNDTVITLGQPLFYFLAILNIALAILFQLGWIKEKYKDKKNLFTLLNLGMGIFSFMFGYNLQIIFDWALPRIEIIIKVMSTGTVILAVIGSAFFRGKKKDESSNLCKS